MFDNEYLDQYSTLVETRPELYASIEIHGVKSNFDPETNVNDCEVDDDNPQFFSAYTRDHENCAYCVADAGMSRLIELRTLVKDLASQHNWEYQDFTVNKFYCAESCEELPNSLLSVGTKILSLHGETSDTPSGQDFFTGTNAEGKIIDVLPEQEHCYSVAFPNDVSVFLSPADINETERYQILKKAEVILLS